MNKFISGILKRLRDRFDLEEMGSNLANILSDLIVALLIFFAFYLLWYFTRRFLRWFMKRTQVDATSVRFILTASKAVLLGLGVIQALSALGINTAALLASLGIVGLTFGFAAQDALSNLISGLLIFWDRPFVIGDLIELEGQYGRVDTITLRSTRVVTVDGQMLAIPNSEVINSTVSSYTNFPNLRLDIDVTIAVDENIDKTRKIMLTLVDKDPDFLKSPGPQVVVTSLNDYNIALQLQVWLEDERQHVSKRFALRENIYKALSEAAINMPFETIQVLPQEASTVSNGQDRLAS